MFEFHIYATEMTNAITPTSWFFIVYIRSQNETDSTSPSKRDFVLY